MTIFINKAGVADFRLRSRPSVGPLFSRIDGDMVFTAFMPAKEIADMAGWTYFQGQIEVQP